MSQTNEYSDYTLEEKFDEQARLARLLVRYQKLQERYGINGDEVCGVTLVPKGYDVKPERFLHFKHGVGKPPPIAYKTRLTMTDGSTQEIPINYFEFIYGANWRAKVKKKCRA